MKKIFYIALAGLALYEVLKVYFIMPMPGSQRMNSIDVAYFLHTYRWFFRIFLGILILFGAPAAFRIKHKWIPVIPLALTLYIIYTFNFEMLAEKMFRQPEKLSFKSKAENELNDSTIVIGVSHNGHAKAYPVRYMSYHHQVRDTIGGKSFMVTYCNVCRSGRVFEPVVRDRQETFRLVGMDHFNAMFEDESTQSWWRQATGEAIAGPLKGQLLPETESIQLTLKKWFERYPQGLVMQADHESKRYYDSLGRFEKGKSKGKLTHTDSLSWKEKSWVVGIQLNGESTAYDWNQLKEKRVLNDVVGDVPVVVAIGSDDQSFVAFERPSPTALFTIRNDTLFTDQQSFTLSGRDISTLTGRLPVIKAYQEFWHSWKTFHPDTKQFE